MKLIKVVLIAFLFSIIASAQMAVFVPLGTTRLVQKSDLVFIAKGVWAEMDLVKGQAAYDACAIMNPNSTNIFNTCDGARQKAINADIQDRVYIVITSLRSGTTPTGGGLPGIAERDLLLKNYRIWIESGL